MTRKEARCLARAASIGLPVEQFTRLKAVHVVTRLHDSMLTVRMFFMAKTAEDPDPFVFSREELI